MKFLLVHQNFPGQFRHLAKALADDPAHQVIGIGDAGNLEGRAPLHPGIKVFSYRPHGRGRKDTHHYLRDFEGHVRRGQSVVRAALSLKEQGFRPDVVLAHPGWGEALFLRDVFPDARHIDYFEFYYHGADGDVGFDPEFPATLDDRLKVRVKNSTQLHSLVACDQGWSPTEWQKQRFPAEFHSRIRVIHEGVDTQAIGPDAGAWIDAGARRFHAGDEVVTYVARNLEPYRGFHVFMRALPALLAQRPDAHVLIVGGDEVSYGRRLPDGQTYRQLYCEELGDRVDWPRVHFLGKLPYAAYLKVLQVSAAHVYLTYPFVLSWSMLEAMAAGCALVASATSPVQEVVRDGENGLLVDFFDGEGLARSVAEVLARPENFRAMRERARRTVVDDYDLRTHCLPRLLEMLEGG
ncbi:MAG: glycosyltransferase family 4 protein [Pseudomonadota bacterium]